MVLDKAGSDPITSAVIGRPVLSMDATGAIAGVKIPSPWPGCDRTGFGASGIARATIVQDITATWDPRFI
jgi:hypothetical protein